MTDFETFKDKNLIQMKIHANQLHKIAVLARAVLDSMGPASVPGDEEVSALENALKAGGFPSYADLTLAKLNEAK